MTRNERFLDQKKSMWNYLKMKVHTSDKWKEIYKDDRVAYEFMLQERYGNKRRKVASCKDLTLNELFDLVKSLTGMEDSRNEDFKGLAASFKQVKYMKDLWAKKARNPSDKALLAFVNRQTGKEYLDLSSVLRTDIRKIIPALQNMKG